MQLDPTENFDVNRYAEAVESQLKVKFKDIPTPLFAAIEFTEEKDFEKIDIALPAILLEVSAAAMYPAVGSGDFRHQDNSIHANLNQLALYAYCTARIYVSSRATDPHKLVRRLAFDVAGFVTHASRFGQPCGMSQVTHIEELEAVRRRETNMIAWVVRWMHSINLGNPDYTWICDDPNISAADVHRVLVGLPPTGENPVEQVPNIDADGDPVADDPNTDIDESKIDTREGYVEVHRDES